MNSNQDQIIFDQGQILTVELPFSDVDKSKLRPVLVLSNSSWNKTSRDIIVAKITGTNYDNTYEVKLTQKELDFGTLKKESYIDLAFIMTVERSLFTKHIATITDKTLLFVKEKMTIIFDL